MEEEVTKKSGIIISLRERPKLKSWILLSLQHVLAMFGATVLTPILINTLAGETVIGTDMALFSSGIGTLIYILVTRAKVPIYLGSSFAYISVIGSLYPIYGSSVFFGLLGVGLVYAIVSLCIFLFGTGWIKKVLPPVVVGPMIMVIGLSLAGVAVNSIGITDIDNMDWTSLAIAVVTIITAMLISLLFRGKMKLIPILGALVVGTIIAMVVTTFHNTHFDTNTKQWNEMVNYGSINWGKSSTYVGHPQFNHTPFSDMGGEKWSFMPFVLMMPIAFATIAEHIGDHTVLGRITGKDYLGDEPGAHKTILGDGLATAFAGLIGAPANTSYGENTTTVGLSKVSSVYVTGLAAIFAVGMSFIQIIPTLLGLIPAPVLGGLEVVLFGFITANGLKTLINERVDFGNSRNIFIVSVMLVIGLGGSIIGWTNGTLEIAFSGTSLAMIAGITANLFLPHDRGIDKEKIRKMIRQNKK